MTYYEVWTQDYDTFGEHDWRPTERFARRDSAERLAELLNRGWGTHARVQPVGEEPPLSTETPEEVDARFPWLAEQRKL